MTKKDFKLLERVFEREIGGCILQSKSKEYNRLENEGMVFATEINLTDQRFPVIIHGWTLTHKGRIAYCNECSKEKEPT